MAAASALSVIAASAAGGAGPGAGEDAATGHYALDSSTATFSVIDVEVLDCGARVVTERMADVRSVTIGVWVGTGSRDEEDDRAGASHFMEHLLFKGTASWAAAEIAEAVDEVGGDMNAFTTKEYTAFYIRLLSEHLGLGLDVLGAIIADPALRPEDIEAERTVILDEILMHADEAADLVAEQCMGALFPGHPLGREVLGTTRSVKTLEASEIRRFFDVHYRASNLVVAAAGDVDHERVVSEVERRLAGRLGGGPPAREGPDAPPLGLVVTRRPTEQVHLVLGMRTAGRHSEDRWPLAVLNHVLGGGMSSRLFQEVRERRGLAYSIWSERTHYDETGSFTVSVGTAPSHVREVLEVVNGELDQLANAGITERELSVAKSHLRAEMLLSLEDSGARMSRIGSSLLLHGHVLEVDELLGKVDTVTLEDVANLAAKLANEPRTLSVVGPFDPADFGG
jgi:predicted Zn-dependent peptidase